MIIHTWRRRAALFSGASLALLGGLLAAGSASAQSAPQTRSPTDDAVQVEDIVVTAQFRGTNLQQTPIAITAITSEMLEARNQTNVTDVAASAPNVVIQKGNAGFGQTPSIYIRGIGAYDFNFALEPGVGIYIDDVYHPTLFGSALDLIDVQRVEILRGPQGTLTGRNSIGGAIRLFSQPPSNTLGGSFTAGVGSDDHLALKGNVSLPLIDDKLALRLSGAYERQDGYVTRLDYGCLNPGSGIAATTTAAGCKLGEEGGYEHGGVRAALRWTPTTRFEANLIADYNTASDDPGATVLIQGRNTTGAPSTDFGRFVGGGGFVNYATYSVPEIGWSTAPVSQAHGGGASLNMVYRFSDALSLTSITGYRAYKSEFSSDADAGPLNASLELNQVRFKSLSQELRLSGGTGPLDWTVGLYYMDGEGHQDGRYDLGVIGLATTTADYLQSDVVDSSTSAAFVHGTYQINPQLTLSLGARYTEEQKDYRFGRVAVTPAAFLNALVDGSVGSYKGHHTDYRVSLDQQVNDDLLVYGSVSTGFRGGGVNPRPFTPAQIASFDPEVLTSYELGFKSRLADRSIRLNGAVFFNDYSDIQETITSGYAGFPASAIPLNAGDAEISGAELEIEAHPVAGLSIDGSLSYLNFKFTELSADAQTSGLTLDMVSPYSPAWRGSLGVQYEVRIGALGSLTPRVDVNYQSELYTNAVNDDRNLIPSVTTLNAGLTWRRDDTPWEASLQVTNVTDKYYYLNIDDTLGGKGTVRGTPARPRTFMLSLRRTF